MHHAVVHHDLRAKRMPDALVSEANAQRRHAAGKAADDFVRQARFTRRARAGRNQDAFRFELFDLIERDLIVAMHLHIHAHFAEVLDEVVGERIVIIDDQQHARSKGNCRQCARQ